MKSLAVHTTLLCWIMFDILKVDVAGGPSKRLCGTALSDMLERVCSQGFYGPSLQKRIGTYGNDYYDENVNLPHPMHKRGVVDECCNRACTLSQLQRYCAGEANDSREMAFSNGRQLPQTDVAVSEHRVASAEDRMGSRMGTLPKAERPMFYILRGNSRRLTASHRRRKLRLRN